MTEMITLSRNELWALLTRTFEAVFRHDEDYYDMARTVLWLECHGLGGVAGLISALPIIENRDLPAPKMTELSTTHAQLDAGGRSLFCAGRTACDLAIANAVEMGRSKIDIVNTTDPIALIGLLSYIRQQGLFAAVLCKDQIAVIGPEMDCPDIYKSGDGKTISIICAQEKPDVYAYVADGAELIASQQNLEQCFASHLDKGVPIKKTEYAKLIGVADRILVEASEASRRGAGE